MSYERFYEQDEDEVPRQAEDALVIPSSFGEAPPADPWVTVGDALKRATTSRRASYLEQEHFELALLAVRDGNSPYSDELKLLLSYYAGLRVKEIVGLTPECVTDARGHLADRIWIPKSISKTKRERIIPMHERVRESFVRMRQRYPRIEFFAFSNYGSIKRQSANAATQWFKRVYKKAGLVTCSSHSGRRSFITNLARSANLNNCSIYDVQRVAGHARLDTTQMYIEPSASISQLVGSLGGDDANRRVDQLRNTQIKKRRG